MLPYDGGFEVKRWNPQTNGCKTYANTPVDFYSVHPIYDFPCVLRPYSTPAFYNHYVYFAPHWGNKFLQLRKESGIFEEWVPQILASLNPKNGYFFIQWKGDFLKESGEKDISFSIPPSASFTRWSCPRASAGRCPSSLTCRNCGNMRQVSMSSPKASGMGVRKQHFIRYRISWMEK